MNKLIFKAALYCIISLIFLTGALTAQNGQSNPKLEAKTKTETVNKITKLLKEDYVFPDIAKKMNEYISSQLKSGAYESIDDPQKFAEQLTSDLQSVSKDKHLRVRFAPEDAKKMTKKAKNGTNPEEEKQWNEMMKKENYGFKKTEILPGNIGYIDLTNFASPQYSKETIASVMGFVANTNAIIFDLRLNGGGDPAGVQLICSYLFGDEPVHLNDLYYRPNDETEEYWTLKKIDGKKMPDVPVYILTSTYTFSAAEEFTYNLKNLKRAVVIGETTGGGAHPGGMNAVNEMFTIFVPVGRAINPITKTNWEGTGVIPDIPVASDKALEQAQVMALEKLSAGTKDEQLKQKYKWMIESLQAGINTPAIDDNILKSYEGTYQDRTITYECGKLYYQRKGRPKFPMTPMTENIFMFKDIEYFRLRVDKDSEGKITGLTGLYDNGSSDSSPRTN